MARVRTAFGRFIRPAGADSLEAALAQPAARTDRIRALQATRGEGPTGRMIGFGVGRIGNWVAFMLGRLNVPLVLIDRDVVEPHNIEAGNSVFRRTDIGAPKPEALKRILEDHEPGVHVEALQVDITSLTAGELLALARGARVALGLVDEGEALFHINEHLYRHLPIVYAAGHRGARTGDVVISRPGGPCLQCLLDIRAPAEIETLTGEPTHGIDIVAIAETCVRVALTLIGDQRLGNVREVLDPAVNFIFLENRRSPTSPGGFAPQFLRVERRRACPVCGAM